MIKVRRLNGKEFVVNSELILYIEETPDTVITLTTGQKVVVIDTVDEVIDMVIEFKAKISTARYKDRVEGKEV
ncbi:MAG: flagellar FlbD family protein [Tissierellia bacterium]|nr:flagellar FlbD family protein [Tissierellia bacterium]